MLFQYNSHLIYAMIWAGHCDSNETGCTQVVLILYQVERMDREVPGTPRLVIKYTPNVTCFQCPDVAGFYVCSQINGRFFFYLRPVGGKISTF